MNWESCADVKEAAEQIFGRGCVINLTPHPVRFPVGSFLWLGDPKDEMLRPDTPYAWIQTNAMKLAGEPGTAMQWVEIPPAEEPYRLREADEPQNWTALNLGEAFLDWDSGSPFGIVAGLCLRRFDVGDVPPEREGVIYIVSLPALMALASAGIYRDDLIAPDTGSTAIRNGSGQITAVRGFVRLAP